MQNDSTDNAVEERYPTRSAIRQTASENHTNKPRQTPPIARALDQLDSSIERLFIRIEGLQSKLKSVSTSKPKSDGNEKEKALPMSSPIEERILTAFERIERAGRLLTDTEEDLDI